ncbi:hypothetical protein LPJ59_007072, partial [Coemansia sp. RSA 2399]
SDNGTMTSQEPAPRPVVSEHANPTPVKAPPAPAAMSAAVGLKGEQLSNLMSVDNMSE